MALLDPKTPAKTSKTTALPMLCHWSLRIEYFPSTKEFCAPARWETSRSMSTTPPFDMFLFLCDDTVDALQRFTELESSSSGPCWSILLALVASLSVASPHCLWILLGMLETCWSDGLQLHSYELLHCSRFQPLKWLDMTGPFTFWHFWQWQGWLERLAKVEDTKGPSKKAGRESGKASAGFRCFWNYGLRQLGIYSDKGVTRAVPHVNVLFQTKPTSTGLRPPGSHNVYNNTSEG